MQLIALETYNLFLRVSYKNRCLLVAKVFVTVIKAQRVECTLHIKRDSKDVLNVLSILNMKGTGVLAADIL